MKILIVEDELNTREAIKKMLKIIEPDSEVIGETGYVKTAVDLILTRNPDVILLDVELEDGTGFNILEKLSTYNFKVVFITAYNQYAIKAFKYSAIDYILKPIDPLELKETLSKLKELFNRENQQIKLIETLKENLENKNRKIVLKTANRVHIVELDEIIRLEADGAYTRFITNSNKITVSKNLKFYEAFLDESFIRCHQSHIVNSKNIVSLDKDNFINISNGNRIPVSSRKRTFIRQFIYGL